MKFKITIFSIQNLNLDFARSYKLGGCLEGVKGWEDTFRHHPVGRDRHFPEEQPWLNTIPCPLKASLLCLCVHNVVKNCVLRTYGRA